MREIKFRAWGEEEKHMTAGRTLKDSILRARDNPNFHWDDSVPIMQYTGLKDKNGNEIYEGDILQTIGDNGERLSKFKIYWGDACWMKEREDGEKFNLESSQKWLEVIGNIYEHQNLLAV